MRDSPSMIRRGVVCFLCTLFLGVAAVHAQDSLPVQVPERSVPVDFDGDILPLLKRNCLACHSASEAEGDLVLESRATIAEGGLSGPAVVAGKSEESLLFQAAAHTGDVVMPPEGNAVGAKNLTPQDLGLLKLWIDQGARASETSADAGLAWRALPSGLDPIYAVAITPNGRYVAAGVGNRLLVYQVATRRLVGELIDQSLGNELVSTSTSEAVAAAHLDLVQSLDFSPDGTHLASGGFRTLKIWRKVPATVERRNREAADDAAIRDAADKQTATWQGSIVELRDANGQVARSFDLGRAVLFAAVAPDGSRLVALGAGGPGKLWDASSGTVLAELHTNVPAREKAAAAEFTLAIRQRQRDHAQRDLEAATGRRKEAEEALAAARKELEAAEAALAEKQKVEQQKAEAGGAEAETARTEREAAERNVAAAKEAVTLNEPAVQGAEQGVKAAEAALEEASRRLAVATGERDRLQRKAGVLSPDLAVAAFSADSAEVALIDVGGTLQTFAAADGSPLEQVATAVEEPRGMRYISERCVRIVTDDAAYEIGALSRWELERTIGSLDRPDILVDRVTAIDFSPDGQLLAAGSGEPSRTGQVRLFDVKTGSLVREVEDVHSDAVLSLAFSPDGERLAGGGADRFARIFHVADGRLLLNLEGHTGHVAAVAWHADGRTLATASADGTLKVWDLRSGEQQKTIDGFGGPLSDVAFLGIEDILVVTGGNTMVAGRKVDGSGGSSFAGMNGFVHATSATRDGRLVIAGGDDGRIGVWRKDGTAVAVLAAE